METYLSPDCQLHGQHASYRPCRSEMRSNELVSFYHLLENFSPFRDVFSLASSAETPTSHDEEQRTFDATEKQNNRRAYKVRYTTKKTYHDRYRRPHSTFAANEHVSDSNISSGLLTGHSGMSVYCAARAGH